MYLYPPTFQLSPNSPNSPTLFREVKKSQMAFVDMLQGYADQYYLLALRGNEDGAQQSLPLELTPAQLHQLFTQAKNLHEREEYLSAMMMKSTFKGHKSPSVSRPASSNPNFPSPAHTRALEAKTAQQKLGGFQLDELLQHGFTMEDINNILGAPEPIAGLVTQASPAIGDLPRMGLVDLSSGAGARLGSKDTARPSPLKDLSLQQQLQALMLAGDTTQTPPSSSVVGTLLSGSLDPLGNLMGSSSQNSQGSRGNLPETLQALVTAIAAARGRSGSDIDGADFGDSSLTGLMQLFGGDRLAIPATTPGRSTGRASVSTPPAPARGTTLRG